MTIKDISNVHQIVWEFAKVGIMMFLSFAMAIITAFFSAVVGKLFRRFSGLITFVVFIITNYVSTNSIVEIVKLVNNGGPNPYMRREVMVKGNILLQVLPNPVFVVSIILIIIVSILLFLATSTIYDRKVEL